MSDIILPQDVRNYIFYDTFNRTSAEIDADVPTYNKAGAALAWHCNSAGQFGTNAAGYIYRVAGTQNANYATLDIGQQPSVIVGSGIMDLTAKKIRIGLRTTLSTGGLTTDTDYNSWEVIFTRTSTTLEVLFQYRVAGTIIAVVDTAGSSASAVVGTADPTSVFPFRIEQTSSQVIVKVPGGSRTWNITPGMSALTSTLISMCITDTNVKLYPLRAW